MSMEKSRNAEPGPSQEELRQVSKSKPTTEFSSATPTKEQIAKRAANDAEVAELRTRLGLEPELSDRRGVEDGLRRPEEEGTFIPSRFGTIDAPRSAKAYEEAKRIRDASYEFGRNLVNDPELQAIIGRYKVAQNEVELVMREGYDKFIDAKYEPLKYPLLTRITNGIKLRLGGNDVIERGSKAIKNRAHIGEQIAAFVSDKFNEAGFNSYPNIIHPVTPNTNLYRIERILGIRSQS